MTLLMNRRRKSTGVAALFSYSAGDSIAGKGGAFARTGNGWYPDINGVVQVALTGVARDSAYVNGRRGLLFEPNTATNLCIASDNLSSWTNAGVATLTSGQVDIYGTTIGYNVSDTSGAIQEGVTIVPTAFTGNAIKALCISVKKGAASAATGSQIQLRDTVALADRLFATLTWSGANPSVAMTTGTYFGSLPLTNGYFALFFKTLSVTAANAHLLSVYPAQAAAEQGDLYFGGVTLTNTVVPVFIIPTTGAGVTRNIESLTFPHNSTPRSRTIYVSHSSFYGEVGSQIGTVQIGAGTDYQATGGNSGINGWSAIVRNNSTNSLPILSLAENLGDQVEQRSAGDSSGTCTVGVSINGGAESTAVGGAGAAYQGAYGGANYTIGAFGYSPIMLHIFNDILGVQSMATCRTA